MILGTISNGRMTSHVFIVDELIFRSSFLSVCEKHAVLLLDRLSGVPRRVVGDRGYTSHAFRAHIWNMGARPAIPPQRHEAPVACPDGIYNNRNQVERLWARLKEWRAIATRYEKTAASFMGVLYLSAALDWLKR